MAIEDRKEEKKFKFVITVRNFLERNVEKFEF